MEDVRPKSAPARRKPRGRFGESNQQNKQHRVTERTVKTIESSEGERDKSHGSVEAHHSQKNKRTAARPNKNYHQYNYKYSSDSDPNWRIRKNNFVMPRGASTEEPVVKASLSANPNEPISSLLNANAQEFVPQVVRQKIAHVKTAALKRMTNLGKVTKNSHGRPGIHEQQSSEPQSRNSGPKRDGWLDPALEQRKDDSKIFEDKHEKDKVGPDLFKKQQNVNTDDPRNTHKSHQISLDHQQVMNTEYKTSGTKYSSKQRQRAQQKLANSNEKPPASDGTTGLSDAPHKQLFSFIEQRPTDVMNVTSQRESLIERLNDATYECSICCCTIKQDVATWHCKKCYHIYHLYCVKKWANTLTAQSTDHNAWRCPMCQEPLTKVPNQYRCFCEKLRDPVWNRHDTPHSCGEVCGKKRSTNCSHPCNELCHPGPCPPCNAFISKHCLCGRSYQKVKCSRQALLRCEQVCNKLKDCSNHRCDEVCHSGPCSPCPVLKTIACHCKDTSKEIPCGSKDVSFSCGKICSKSLSCQNHQCELACHEGECPSCKTSPEVVFRCPCGKNLLKDLEIYKERTSCLDPIPVCGQICDKVMSCSTPGEVHKCQRHCHKGGCDCKLYTEVTCRCSNKTVSMKCSEARQYTSSAPYLCEKKCQKKRQCGRHKCGQSCCIETEHICMQICGKRLSCGLHRCQELCHRGNCPKCFEVGFDELRCHCGTQVIYPPVQCGTKTPECDLPCNRVHDCDHPVIHPCHTERSCPPCPTLTKKRCMGGHEERENVPCHIKNISCGRPCGKELACGDHRCIRACHMSDCNATICTQPCSKPRAGCGHPCKAPCHPGKDCPLTDCKAEVNLQCACRRKKEKVPCYLISKKTKSSIAALSLKLNTLNTDVDVAQLTKLIGSKQLDCDEDCDREKRNRSLASALEIHDSDLFAELGAPQFSDFLKNIARKNPLIVSQTEKALCELVKSAQQSKHVMRSHAFPSMKREQRQAVHELAELYGCETVSYDEEPNRNVVAMARRGKCHLPAQTLTSYIKSEKCPRPPLPMPASATDEQIRDRMNKQLLNTNVEEEQKIDYFEMTQAPVGAT